MTLLSASECDAVEAIYSVLYLQEKFRGFIGMISSHFKGEVFQTNVTLKWNMVNVFSPHEAILPAVSVHVLVLQNWVIIDRPESNLLYESKLI